jgi:hypothetical protein
MHFAKEVKSELQDMRHVVALESEKGFIVGPLSNGVSPPYDGFAYFGQSNARPDRYK